MSLATSILMFAICLKQKKGAEEIIISKESKDVAWIKQNEVLKHNNEYSIKRMLNKGKYFKKI